MNFDELDKMGSDFTFTLPDKRPTLDDVMDWYSLARESGESLADWQSKYPYYADDLAEFELFLQKTNEDTQII